MKRLACAALLSITPLLFCSACATQKHRGVEQQQQQQQHQVELPATCKPAIKNPDSPQQFLSRHEGFLKDKQAALEKGPVELVFIGDSITDAWRRGPQNKVFNDRWGKYNPLNLGISGDKTEHVLWRLANGEVDGIKPKLVVVMIGTNNLGNPPKATPEDTAAGIKCIVAKLREKLPHSKILLLGVFPRGMEPDHAFRAQIKTVNDTISQLDDNGRHVKYVDISQKFLADDGTLTKEVMPDALHPGEKGYQIWADAISPTIEEMMRS